MPLPLILQRIPPISTCVLLTTLGCAVATRIGLAAPYDFSLNWPMIRTHWQLWRLVTFMLFTGGFGLQWMVMLYMDFSNLFYLERENFTGRPWDFLGFLGLTWGLILAYCGVLGLGFGFQVLSLAVCYLWCRKNPNHAIAFFGVIAIPAPYYPLVRVALALVFSQPVRDIVVGILVGHVYFYLDDIFPRLHDGRRPLHDAAVSVCTRFRRAKRALTPRKLRCSSCV